MTTRARLQILTALYLAAAPAAFAGDVVVDGSFVSTVPTGTAPLAVDSTTLVPNLNADLLDGLDSTRFMRDVGNVVLVGKTGGDFSSIQAALSSITAASQADPYLVLVGPGTYQEQVTMKQWVDIQGSGQGVTTISWAGGGLGNQTVSGVSNAELRHLTVVNSGNGEDDPWAIYILGHSPTLTHVTAIAETTGVGATAIRIAKALTPFALAPEMTHVKARAYGDSAIAIDNRGGSPLLFAVDAFAIGESSIGFNNVFDATPVLRQVVASASAAGGIGQAKGFAIDGGSATLRDVEASGAGANTNWGLFASGGADVEMIRVEARASGDGTTCYALQAISSTVTIHGSEVVASGCDTANQAIRNDRGDVRVYDSHVQASSATSYGVFNHNLVGSGEPGTVGLHNSQVIGFTHAVDTGADCTTKVGASLVGGAGTTTGAGTNLCAGVHDEAMAFTAGPLCP